MNSPILKRLQLGMRWRRALIALACWLPLVAATLLLVHGSRSMPMTAAVAVLMVALLAGWLWRALGKLDTAHVVRRLDTRMPALDDSSDLLLRDDAGLSALARMQRQRVLDRVSGSRLPDLRDPWPWLRIGLLAVVAVAVALASLYRPVAHTRGSAESLTAPSTERLATVTQLKSVRLDIQPPAYTGLPSRKESSLDAEIAQDSELRWNLDFEPEPESAALRFHDGSEIELHP
ncbi:MAG: hypothetical protein WBP53_04395, partial [Dokdonella sp.]